MDGNGYQLLGFVPPAQRAGRPKDVPNLYNPDTGTAANVLLLLFLKLKNIF